MSDATLRWRAACEASQDDDGVWRFAPGFTPDGFRAVRRDHLAAIEPGHFWFPPRRRLLARLLRRIGPADATSAIELGCGTGGFLPELAGRYPTVVGLDAYDASLKAAQDRAPFAVLVQADACRTPLAGGQFDLVAALDVLEHVEPATFLREARRLVRDGGWLLLSVPAFPCLWSALDEAAGHRCRYRRGELAGRARGQRLAARALHPLPGHAFSTRLYNAAPGSSGARGRTASAGVAVADFRAGQRPRSRSTRRFAFALGLVARRPRSHRRAIMTCMDLVSLRHRPRSRPCGPGGWH